MGNFGGVAKNWVTDGYKKLKVGHLSKYPNLKCLLFLEVIGKKILAGPLASEILEEFALMWFTFWNFPRYWHQKDGHSLTFRTKTIPGAYKLLLYLFIYFSWDLSEIDGSIYTK